MTKSLALNSEIARLSPEFDHGNWSINDTRLAGTVERALVSSVYIDEQLPYLAEAICLDNYSSTGRTDELTRFLLRMAEQGYANNNTKYRAIQLLCEDAQQNSSERAGTHLERLLLAQPARSSKLETVDKPLLEALKNSAAATRIGDTVIIPATAEIYVLGDTHADYASTSSIINDIKRSGALNNGAYVVFVGDYSNNGVKSYDNLVAVLELREAHPQGVILLSGNHEFKESYQTALKQYLHVHWDRFSRVPLPAKLQDRIPQLNNHYGHLRLELVKSFGFERGEYLYDLCSRWGQSLPCVCLSGDLMISHSLGMVSDSSFTLDNLVNAKHCDIDDIDTLGYETWSVKGHTQHSCLVNNRHIIAAIVNSFAELFGVSKFVVGHCHYRSGDTKRIGRGLVTTIASSNPYSPDSGHFMYQQMHIARNMYRADEHLTEGDGVPGYLRFKPVAGLKRKMQLLKFIE